MRKCKEEHWPGAVREKNHGRRGPSSFYKLDSNLAFEKMNLKKGEVFVDLGCGAGDYSLYASDIVGDSGKVYAVDVWTEIFDGINEEASLLSINNLITVESDICRKIELEDSFADHCLLATVMHSAKLEGKSGNLFPEIVRILKPDACLSVIECKKEETPFGPPYNMRVSPEELESFLKGYGFIMADCIDLGYYYMSLFNIGDKQMGTGK